MQPAIIPQYFEQYNSYSDLLKDITEETSFAFRSKKVDPANLLGFELLFIIGEPGYGKTTLLNQIRALLDKENINYNYQNGTENTDGTERMDSKAEYYIFDALDENRDVVASYIEVYDYCRLHGIRLIITNRSHYLSQIGHLLIGTDFKFIKLLPFDDPQIVNFLQPKLKKLKYQRSDIESIIQQSKVNSGPSILSVPRYLNEFSKYLLQQKLSPVQVKQLGKSQLFEKVVYFKLESEDKKGKGSSNQKYLTKRVLERLALVMEIHGLNQISKEDFITFLDQTDSNISLIFLNSIDLDDLLQRVMKTTGEFFQFENSEIQEYLAAKELSRLGYRFQTVHDLMIEPQLKLIGSNWIDVLNFAIDIEPSFVRPIVTFIRNSKYEGIEEKLIEIIMDVSHVHFEPAYQDLFFETIFGYYSAKVKSIYKIGDRLAQFITPNNTGIYQPIYQPGQLASATRHIQSNQILLIEILAKSQRLSDGQGQRWTAYLLSLAQDDELYSMQTTIFYALIAIGNSEALLALMDVFEKKEDYLLNNYMMAVTNLVPNDPRVFGLISRSISTDRRLDNLHSSINKLTAADAIIEVFNAIALAPVILRRDSFYYGSSFYTLFGKIKELDSMEVDHALEQFILKILGDEGYAHYIPQLCMQALAYLVEKDASFLQQVMELKTFVRAVDEIAKAVALHIDVKSFKTITSFLKKTGNEWRLERMVRLVAQELENDKTLPLYLHIDKQYLQVWAKRIPSYQASPQKTDLEQLREYYLKDEDFFSPELVPLFVNKFEVLEPQLEADDRKQVSSVVSTILKHYQPDQFQIEIFEVDQNQTRFGHNQDTWFHIELYFKAAYLLGEKRLIRTYREKLLKTLPRMDIFEHRRKQLLENLIHTIAPLSHADMQMLHDFCMGRPDDMLALSASSLARVAKTFGLHQLNPVLLLLVQNPKVKYFDKEEALSAFGSLATGEADFNALNGLFNSPDSTAKMKDIANAALVTNYHDQDAILWRFGELRNRMRELDTDHKYNGTSGVSLFEMEMDRPEFPNCLYGIKHPLIHQQMLELLTYSFELRDKRLQFRYSTYLQQVIYAYFKTFVSTRVLSDLRKVAARFPIAAQTLSFSLQLDELVKDLRLQKKSREPFISAIQGLNHILSKVYLPINSNEELKELVLKVVNTEIKSLIENEGFYRLSDQLKEKPSGPSVKVGEAIIQKTLKIALEKALMENGLRKSDIYREVENLGGLKYDYLISYGLYGPIMVELKLLHNEEIQQARKRADYRKKMARYLGANQQMGIYVVFQIHNNPKHLLKYKKLVEEYREMDQLDIPFIQCYDDTYVAPRPANKNSKTASKNKAAKRVSTKNKL